MLRGAILKRGQSYVILYEDWDRPKLETVGPNRRTAERALRRKAGAGKRPGCTFAKNNIRWGAKTMSRPKRSTKTSAEAERHQAGLPLALDPTKGMTLGFYVESRCSGDKDKKDGSSASIVPRICALVVGGEDLEGNPVRLGQAFTEKNLPDDVAILVEGLTDKLAGGMRRMSK